MTSTFTARDVTSITHEPKKAQHSQSRSEIQKRWSACTCMAAYARFSNKQKDTQTSESKGLTFANGINPNKETSCFLEHNTAKPLCGEQAVNTRTHNPTCTHQHTQEFTKPVHCTSLYMCFLAECLRVRQCRWLCLQVLVHEIIFVGCRGENCVCARERVRVSKRRKGGRESR